MKKLILISALLSLILSNANSQATTSFVKVKNTAYYDSLGIIRNTKIFDKYGNEYLPSEIVIQKRSLIDSNSFPIPQAFPFRLLPPPCVSGMFEIYFSPEPTTSAGTGFDLAANRAVICQVFSDISRLIFDVNPTAIGQGRVKIWVASDAAAIANGINMGTNFSMSTSFNILPTGLFSPTNAIIDNEIAKTIKGGRNSYENLPQFEYLTKTDGIFHGYACFNFGSHTMFNDMTTAAVPTTEKDLYSSALHEALSMLGIESYIGMNGASSNLVFSTYDQYLKRGNPTISSLITYSGTNWTYTGGITSLAVGCGVANTIHYSGNNVSGIPVYSTNGGLWKKGLYLSTLSCNTTCAGNSTTSSNNYATSFCSDLGPNYVKRRPHADEVKVLCDLGYTLQNINGVYAYGNTFAQTSLSSIYQTYPNCDINNCYAVGYTDKYTTTLNSTLTIPISGSATTPASITSNDFNAGGGINPTDIKCNYGTTTIVGGNLVYVPPTGQVGIAVIGYFPRCSTTGINGSMGYIYIDVVPPPTSCGSPVCNMVANGSFETSNYPTHWCNFYTSDDPLQFNQSPDLYFKNGTQVCVRDIKTGSNTSNCVTGGFPSVPGGQHYFGGTGYNENDPDHLYEGESITVKMCQNMVANRPYELSYYSRGLFGTQQNLDMRVFGDDQSVCPKLISSTYLSGLTSICGFQSSQLNIQPNANQTTWTKFTNIITPTKLISDLVFMPSYNASIGTPSEHMFIDEVEVTPHFTVTTAGNHFNKCHGNTVTLTPGVSINNGHSYTYQWQLNGVNIAGANSLSYGVTTDGTYKLIVTCNGFCEKTVVSIVSFRTPIIPNPTITNTTCSLANGAITLNPSGSAGGYSYAWSGCTSCSSNSRTGLSAGNYIITITDAANCTQVVNYTLTNNNTTFTINPTKTDPICTSINGTINTTLSAGGTAPYTYIWSPSSLSGANVSGLGAGTYNLTVMDVNNCSATTTVVLSTINTSLNVLTTPTNSICNLANGAIAVSITNGTSPYTYSWSPSSVSGAPVLNLVAGTYAVTATDVNGCTGSKSTTITTSVSPVTVSFNTTNVNCATNSATLTAIGANGVAPYTYLWSTGATSQTITGTVGTTYSVTVTDANLCTKVESISASVGTNYINIGDGTPYPNSTNLLTAFTGLINGKNFYAIGDFTVDDKIEFLSNNIIVNSGKKIIVNTNSGFIVTSCNFSTCSDKLWKGIEVINNSIVDFNNNTVKDAFYAFEYISSGDMGSMNNNIFSNNIIGILSDSNNHFSSIAQGISNFNFTGNTFNQTATNLKLPYTGMPTTSTNSFLPPNASCLSMSWAGMVFINNNNALTSYIGDQAGPKNLFSNIINGVFIKNGNHEFSNTQFATMTNSTGNSGTSQTSCAISLQTDMPITASNGNFSFIGLGKSNSISTFDNMFTGIDNTGFSIDNISQSKMINIHGYGIYSRTSALPGSFNANITQNDISARYGGISILNYTTGGIVSRLTSTINFNTLMVTCPSIVKNRNAYGIRLEKSSLDYYDRVKVEDNIISSISTNNMARGIYMYTFKSAPTYAISCHRNTITINNPAYAIAGIEYARCDLKEGDNSITSTNQTLQSTLTAATNGDEPMGIFYNNTRGTFRCNYVNTIRTGYEFFSNCGGTGTKFLKNSSNDHFTGLRINKDVTLAPQLYSSNTFNCSNCTIANGRNEAVTFQNTGRTLFTTTNLASQPQFRPSPLYVITGAPSTFFKTGNGADNSSCISGGGGSMIVLSGGSTTIGTTTIGYGVVYPIVGGGFVPLGTGGTALTDLVLSEADTAALTGSLAFSSYNPEQLWLSQSELYQKLLPFKTNFTSSSIFTQFIIAMEIGNMNEFNTLAIQGAELYDLSSAQLAQLTSWNEALDSLSYQFDAVSLAISNLADIDTLALDSLNAQNLILMNYKQYYQSQIDYLYAAMQTVAENNAEEILEGIDTIVPSQSAEALLLDFNNIYYQTFGIGNMELTSAQRDMYMILANTCPVEHPDVVYRSRAIVSSFNDSIIYYDSTLCATAGYTYYSTRVPSVKNKPLTCKLFPNPTENYTKILFSEIPKTPLTFIISDMLGRVLILETKQMTMNLYEIDAKNWEIGFYLIKVYNGKNTIYNAKFQLIK